MQVHIPAQEYTIKFALSGGKGGQNVNKVSTKAQLRWPVGASHTFDEQQKALIRTKLRTRLNSLDEVVLQAESQRSQLQNKQQVVARLHELVAQALTVRQKRIPTRPTRSSQRKRVEQKVRHARQKKLRRAHFD